MPRPIVPASCLESYTTLASRVSKKLEIKRSKFHANAASIENEEGAFRFLSKVSDYRATHNCWAFKLRDRYRSSDDGEPRGTAGKPIYGAIESCGLDCVMVVVTRYYGGTKLGVGGLTRAYGAVALDCLKEARTCIVRAKVSLRLRLGFDSLGVVYSLLERYEVQKQEQFYEDEPGGQVEMQLKIDKARAQDFERDIRNACRGNVSISRD